MTTRSAHLPEKKSPLPVKDSSPSRRSFLPSLGLTVLLYAMFRMEN